MKEPRSPSSVRRGRRSLILGWTLATALSVLLYGCGKGSGFFALGIPRASATTTQAVPTVTTSPVTPTSFTTGGSPVFVSAGDFNRDGRLDPVVANASDGTISIFPNETPGTTPPAVLATSVSFTSGNHPIAIAVGDFNGDGVSDVVVVNRNDNNVAVFLNLTPNSVVNPVFSTAALFGVGATPVAVAVGDFNADGKPDIAVANSAGNTVSVLMNLTTNGAVAPVFAAAQTFTVGTSPSAIAVADVNRDGKTDIVVTDQTSSMVSILLNTTPSNNAAATFLTDAEFATGGSPIAVALQDVNGDGVLDVVTANAGDNSVSVLVNATATGTTALAFTPVHHFTLVGTPTALAVADLNGDGKREIVTAISSTSQIDVLVNSSSGGVVAFTGQATYNSPTAPASLFLFDANSDNKLDVAVVSPTANALAIEINQTPSNTTTPVLVRTFERPTLALRDRLP